MVLLPASAPSGAVVHTSSNAPNERPHRSNIISEEEKTAAASSSFSSFIVYVVATSSDRFKYRSIQNCVFTQINRTMAQFDPDPDPLWTFLVKT